MKPTEHTLKLAATSKTGRFATLRGLLCVRGSGAPAHNLVATPLIRLSLITLGACAALLALSTAPAQAEAPKLVSYGKFQIGEDPFGVAVDNSSLASAGDVYVTGIASSRINKYEAAGKLISPPSPFGEGSGFYSGAGVNPANGDVYIVDAGGQEIDTYDPSSGALIGTPFSVSGCANRLFGQRILTQMATDSAGNVYLACAPKNEVEVFNSTGGEPSGVAATIAGTGANALSAPTGVAVDSVGNVWVADDGDNRIEEFSSAGAFMAEIKLNKA